MQVAVDIGPLHDQSLHKDLATVYVCVCVCLQPEYGEPPNPKDFLPPLVADRDSHIGDDLILQVSYFCTRVLLGFFASHTPSFFGRHRKYMNPKPMEPLPSQRGYHCVIFIFRLLLKITEWYPH